MLRANSTKLVWAVKGVPFMLLVALAAPAFAAGGADEARLGAWMEEMRRGEPDVLVSNGFGGMEPGRRCGTVSGDPEWRAAVEEGLELWRQLFPEPEERARSLPVAVHVVHKANGEGNLTDAEVLAQIAVLNDAYDSVDFTFEPVTIDRKKKKKWFKKCDAQNPFINMTQALAIDPAHTVNIYTCRPRGGLLGYAFLPGSFTEDSVFNAVVLHYGTLPGGFLFPYDEGDTGTHEVGHYCGLLHTFSPWDDPFIGDGCVPPGDEVSDTKYEHEPAYGCPIGRDTCPQAGNDPVRNYMDYSDDACMNKFSPKQGGRMNDLLDMFRPSWGN